MCTYYYEINNEKRRLITRKSVKPWKLSLDRDIMVNKVKALWVIPRAFGFTPPFADGMSAKEPGVVRQYDAGAA